MLYYNFYGYEGFKACFLLKKETMAQWQERTRYY
ncbi:hypothetical protein IMSAGC004_02897 [Bacteroidaceae bacterium]|nr:hypothetical protein IMSAGC004_02897 [Bacteroidaceae bacterium]